jgi:hypothetical protein
MENDPGAARRIDRSGDDAGYDLPPRAGRMFWRVISISREA